MIDRLGGKKTLIIAIIASAIITFVMYPALGSMWAYIILFWLVTLFGVVGAPGTSYVASRSVKPELVSVAITTIFISISIASIIGGFLSGTLLASIGLEGTILVAATIELIGGLLMFGLPKI
ncbi:MAG: MFS transporter [Ignisphaera sp.]